MVDDNNISLDVTAEQQLFAPSIKPSDLRSAQIDNSMPEDMALPESVVFKPSVDPPLHESVVYKTIGDPPLPESVVFKTIVDPSLMESIVYQATKVEVSEKTSAAVADVGIKLQVKFDPEASYKRLEENVDGLQNTVKSLADNTQNAWIPNPSPSSKFEERPTLEPTNLIFDARAERFAQYPNWA